MILEEKITRDPNPETKTRFLKIEDTGDGDISFTSFGNSVELASLLYSALEHPIVFGIVKTALETFEERRAAD